MDCKAARLLLEFARPRPAELEPGDGEALAEHLADCPDCAAAAGSEQRIDEHLGRALRDVPVPEGLRGRLLERLHGEAVRRGRRRWLRGASLAAAAAAILAAVWLAWGRKEPLTRVSPEEAWHEVTAQAGNRPDRIEEWFLDTYQIKTVAPLDLNYNLLISYDLAHFQGRQVPRLLFIRDGERATVYLLSDSQFDLHELLHAQPMGYNVRVLTNPVNPHFAYVMVYTGQEEDFRLFFEKEPISAT
jgi:hypothetical protein